SLQGAKFVTAIGQERDALRYLMEARNTVQQALIKQPRSVRAQARAFDRLQRQKLRRPNEKAETLPQIAEELAKLADEEDEVARQLAALGFGQAEPTGGGTGEPGDPKTNATAPEKPDPANPGAPDKPDQAKPMPKGSGPDRKAMAKGGKDGEDPTQERQD